MGSAGVVGMVVSSRRRAGAAAEVEEGEMRRRKLRKRRKLRGSIFVERRREGNELGDVASKLQESEQSAVSAGNGSGSSSLFLVFFIPPL